MTQIGTNKDTGGKPRSFYMRPSSNMKKPKTQHQVLVQEAADSLAGAYHGIAVLGVSTKRLEEKTAMAVYVLMEQIETVEELDEIISAVRDEKAKEALTKAADKLLGRNQPAWYEDQGLVQGLLIGLAIVGLMAAFVF
jgi:hypothetical protein